MCSGGQQQGSFQQMGQAIDQRRAESMRPLYSETVYTDGREEKRQTLRTGLALNMFDTNPFLKKVFRLKSREQLMSENQTLGG